MAKIKDHFWEQITKTEYEEWLDKTEPTFDEEDFVRILGGENVKQDTNQPESP